MQQKGVHHTENGGVGANAESEREDGDDGEAGTLAQGARGVAQILEQRLDEGKRTPLAIELLGGLEATELHERLAAGFLRSHAGAQIVIHVHLEMAFHFGGELKVVLIAAEQTEGTY